MERTITFDDAQRIKTAYMVNGQSMNGVSRMTGVSQHKIRYALDMVMTEEDWNAKKKQMDERRSEYSDLHPVVRKRMQSTRGLTKHPLPRANAGDVEKEERRVICRNDLSPNIKYALRLPVAGESLLHFAVDENGNRVNSIHCVP